MKAYVRDYIFWALVAFVLFMSSIISMSVFDAMGIELQKNLRIFVHGPIACIVTALVGFPLYLMLYRPKSGEQTDDDESKPNSSSS